MFWKLNIYVYKYTYVCMNIYVGIHTDVYGIYHMVDVQ